MIAQDNGQIGEFETGNGRHFERIEDGNGPGRRFIQMGR